MEGASGGEGRCWGPIGERRESRVKAFEEGIEGRDAGLFWTDFGEESVNLCMLVSKMYWLQEFVNGAYLEFEGT